MRIITIYLTFILWIGMGMLRAQTLDTLGKPQAIPPNQDSMAAQTHNKVSGYIFQGKIIDAATGEGLPFATIVFPHTAKGTATDLDGNFSYRQDELPSDTIKIQALGYDPVFRKLNHAQHEFTLNIEMQRSASNLTEYTIKAKGVDPALLLLKRIIEHKPQNNPDRTHNYQYVAYNRLEVDMKNVAQGKGKNAPILKNYQFAFHNLDSTSEETPFLPLYLTESISDYYFRRSPKKEREVIKASLSKGVNNKEVSRFLGTAYLNVNIYNNGIPVLDKKFVSPISNEGPVFYKYAIKDTQRAFGHNIILVQFRPKRDGELCFTGDFWVVDSVYAIERISMEVPKTVNLNWTDKVSLYQEFTPVDSVWFCTKDKFIAAVSPYGSKKIPGFIARKTATYHNIIIDKTAIDDSLDKPEWKENVIIPDSVAYKTDDWWAQHRPDTLTTTEKAIHKMVDTVLSMPLTQHYIRLFTFIVSGVKDFGPIELGPYWFLYSNNPVEGHRFRISVGTPRSLNNLHVSGYVAYGLHDQVVKWGGDEKWVLSHAHWTYLYSTFSHDLSQGIDNFDHVPTDNLLSSLERKPNTQWKQAFLDNRRVEFYKLFFNGYSNTLILQNRVFTPYTPLPSSMFVNEHGNPSDQVTSSQIGLEFRYAFKEKYLNGKYKRINAGTKYPIADFIYTAGIKNVLNSAYSFHKLNFSIKESINVPPFGHISYNLYGGIYSGKLPYPLLEVHPGNEFLYYDPNAFEMMNSYEFLSDKFLALNFEHDLGGGIFNHIPLLKKLKFRQFWTAKAIVGSLSDENKALNLNSGFPFRTLEGNPYLELGTGVSNILKVARIDFVWRVAPTPLGGESIEKHFGIFGSVQLEF